MQDYTFKKPTGLTPEMEGYFFTGKSQHVGHATPTKGSKGNSASGGGGVRHGHDVVSYDVDGGFARELATGKYPGDLRLHKHLIERESARLRQDELSIEMASRHYDFNLKPCREPGCNTLLHEHSNRSYCKRCRTAKLESLKAKSTRRRASERKRAGERNLFQMIANRVEGMSQVPDEVA